MKNKLSKHTDRVKKLRKKAKERRDEVKKIKKTVSELEVEKKDLREENQWLREMVHDFLPIKNSSGHFSSEFKGVCICITKSQCAIRPGWPSCSVSAQLSST